MRPERQMQGKRLPISDYAKLNDGLVRLPLSVMNVDVWGADIKKSPLFLTAATKTEFYCRLNAGLCPCRWPAPTFCPYVDVLRGWVTICGRPTSRLGGRVEKVRWAWMVGHGGKLNWNYLVDDSDDHLAPHKSLSGRPVQTVPIYHYANLTLLMSISQTCIRPVQTWD